MNRKQHPNLHLALALILSAFLFLAPAFAASCSSPTSNSGDPPENSEGKIDYSKQSAWEFVSGKSQSPVDIPAASITKSSGDVILAPAYASGATQLEVEDNGHAIEALASSWALINARRFTLKQFHFHVAAEHTIDSKGYAMEVHFVHEAEDGRIAVIGVLFEVGEANPALDLILEGAASHEEILVELAGLFPESLACYHYNGSLTTPPLSENVEWYVLCDALTLSSEQLEAFSAYYSSNNRDVQPLNGRTVLVYGR